MSRRDEMSKQERKDRPLARGVLDYFPDALMEVANLSLVANEQHNPGEPMHWAKGKSTDEADALLRHLIDRGRIDTDGLRHSAKVAWRALAMLQREIEAEREEIAQGTGTEVSFLPEQFLRVDPVAPGTVTKRDLDFTVTVHHDEPNADNGELPAPHYEGDFGTMKQQLDRYEYPRDVIDM